MEETLYGLPKKEVRRRRCHLFEILRTYTRKHYDARCIIPSFIEMNDWLNARGCHLSSPDFCGEEYWEDPTHYNRQHLNKNPITSVVDGIAIRTHRTSPQKPKAVVTKAPENKRVTPDVSEEKNSYYKISISWSETENNQKPCMSKIIQFFEELGLPKIEQESWEVDSTTTEHCLAYKFEGTEDGFTMLKRSSMVILDILNENNNFEIAIHGKKITL